MRIYAPVKDFNGLRNNVRFVNGVGETDDPKVIAWFESHGYSVEKCEKPVEIPAEKCEKSPENPTDKCDEVEEPELMGYAERKANFEDMTPNEIREWAKANGYGLVIKNIRNKEKLIELLRG